MGLYAVAVQRYKEHCYKGVEVTAEIYKGISFDVNGSAALTTACSTLDIIYALSGLLLETNLLKTWEKID